MAGAGAGAAVPIVPGARVLVVEARFHARINDLLLAGARRALETAGAKATWLTVPGALEIPAAIAIAEAAGGFDAYVALGCVIRGETTHYELVSEESCRGLMDLGTRQRVAIGNGILTVENEAQAIVRADPEDQDKGGGAVVAALSLVAWRQRLVESRR
ncbi:MAG: 6,7-dimethyl-8-ribityllumazine synthase [Geminicoccaceae bacterium]